jgi:amino acid transporter
MGGDGVLTMIGALSYGELAAMMPKAGGQYVYLRESLGPLWGFLYGWTLFLVIQTGTIAAVCVAFGKFLGVFFLRFRRRTGCGTSRTCRRFQWGRWCWATWTLA